MSKKFKEQTIDALQKLEQHGGKVSWIRDFYYNKPVCVDYTA